MEGDSHMTSAHRISSLNDHSEYPRSLQPHPTTHIAAGFRDVSNEENNQTAEPRPGFDRKRDGMRCKHFTLWTPSSSLRKVVVGYGCLASCVFLVTIVAYHWPP